MKRYFRGRLRSLKHGDSGFTLVELLVVVGIIVALAAVIIPNVATFAGRGDTGAQNAEEDNIQAAMDAMMADKAVVAVATIANPGTSTNAWNLQPVPGDAAVSVLYPDYMREQNTKYWYCYDGTGLITRQDLTASAVCP